MTEPSEITGFCFTNLDEHKQTEWPRRFVTRPMVGDYIQGIRGDKRPILRVVAVTHATSEKSGEPRLRIELHR